MLYWHVVVLAVLQGLTEFLPVSSSAHLVLVPVVTGWPDQGLAFDIAMHVGTLAAVVFYFRRELASMSHNWVMSVVTGRQRGDARLAWGVLWGTVPVGLAGLLLSAIGDEALRSPLVIAVATIVFGVVLWWAHQYARQERDEYSLHWRDVMLIGAAQMLALIPGTSRSGITISAGLMLGLTGKAAARFSFLLSIPVIILAGLLKGLEAVHAGIAVDWPAVGLGILLSAITAYLCIHFFLKLLDRIGMLPFVIYRLLLGGVLLAVFW